MQRIDPSSANQAWFFDKNTEIQAPVKRGRKASTVDKKLRDAAGIHVRIAHGRLRTWQAVGEFYGLSKAAAYRIANDNDYRSSSAVLEHIVTTGIPTPPLIPTHPCPSCAAHGIISSHCDKLNCHDKPVVAVALLAPGEVVKPALMPKRKRLKVRRPYMGHELSVAMNDHGITDAMVRELVKAELSRR